MRAPASPAPIARATRIEQVRDLGRAASPDRDAKAVAARDAASA
jgi:hypothetical protein